MLRWYRFVCTKFTQTDNKKWYVFIPRFHTPCSWLSRTLIHCTKSIISVTFGIYWQNIYLLHSVLLNLHVARVMMCWVRGCWFREPRVELVSTRGWGWLVLVVHDVVGVRCRGSAAGCWGSEAVGKFRAGSLPGTFLSKATQQSVLRRCVSNSHELPKPKI